jgi:uncharacterized protein YodC (DUF2158 family)
MPTAFTVGQVVQLKSGGPPMTVTSIDSSGDHIKIDCTWFDGATIKTGSFLAEALQEPSLGIA